MVVGSSHLNCASVSCVLTGGVSSDGTVVACSDSVNFMIVPLINS